jgi:soluble lytic murein transglycosylase-like protein
MARIFAWIAALVTSFALCSPGFAAEKDHNAANAGLGRSVPAAMMRPAAEVFDLAARYEHGEGVTQSYEHALALYCEAARRGESRAFFNLGWMFLYGRGVPQDGAIAVAWLRKAADRGTQQAANLLRLMPSQSPSTASGCPATFGGPATPIAAPAKIRDLVARTAHELGIDPQLVMAVIAVESAFNPRAVSPKNAQGLMQLMPETAARFGVSDPFDEKENVRGGTTYLRDLLKRFDGDLVLALAAYNAGEGAIVSSGGVPPYRETRDYVERVTRLCACNGPEF